METEETIETQLITLLSTYVANVDIVGALTPAPDGVQKHSPDTYISVIVDIADQFYDLAETVTPFHYSARVTVHCAFVDDKTGTLFRDICRGVRQAISLCLGDGCAALSSDTFACDGLQLVSTQTALDTSAETGGMVKTYNMTITGRVLPSQTTSSEGSGAESPSSSTP